MQGYPPKVVPEVVLGKLRLTRTFFSKLFFGTFKNLSKYYKRHSIFLVKNLILAQFDLYRRYERNINKLPSGSR